MRRNTALIGILVAASLAVIALGVLQLALGAGGAQQSAVGPTPSIAQVRRINVGDLHAKLQGANPPLVWDIRSAESYAQQHIPGARLVQMAEIPALAQTLDRKQAIVTLCA